MILILTINIRFNPLNPDVKITYGSIGWFFKEINNLRLKMQVGSVFTKRD